MFPQHPATLAVEQQGKKNALDGSGQKNHQRQFNQKGKVSAVHLLGVREAK